MVLKSALLEVVQLMVFAVSPAVPLTEVAPLGDALSTVMVAGVAESAPACAFVLVKAVTVPPTAYERPGGTGMLAWLFGVMRTLNCVAEVLTGIAVPPEKFTVLLAGFAAAAKYSVAPLSDVMRTSLKLSNEFAPVSVTVSAVTESVPPLVTSVNASRSVMDAPGAMVLLPGSVPSAMVVVFAGALVVPWPSALKAVSSVS